MFDLSYHPVSSRTCLVDKGESILTIQINGVTLEAQLSQINGKYLIKKKIRCSLDREQIEQSFFDRKIVEVVARNKVYHLRVLRCIEQHQGKHKYLFVYMEPVKQDESFQECVNAALSTELFKLKLQNELLVSILVEKGLISSTDEANPLQALTTEEIQEKSKDFRIAFSNEVQETYFS